MEQQDLERIARLALRELGEPSADVTVKADAERPGVWHIHLGGASGRQLKIRCSEGTTAQYVREQVFQQFTS